MTRPRDEKGRFVRADGKPTLHRQVDDRHKDTLQMMGGEPEAPEWLQLQPPLPIYRGPRIELGTLLLAALLLAIVAVVFGGLAWVSGGGRGL